ncbi:MAG: hypothetical protein JNL98_03205 [Bryobacterales bacterium]|nr:hypothetical protein [Bryobacterales bacterium]
MSTGATYGAILGTNPLYVQVVIPYPMTVSAITGKTNTAAGTGQSIAAALYDAGGTQIINAHGRVVEPGAGTLTISFAAPVSLMAGTYYLGIASEDNTVSILTSDLSATMLNVAGAKRVATGTGVTTGTGSTYAMPGLMGTTSAVDVAIPALYLVR